MKKQLNKQLSKMTDNDYYELRLRLDVAELIRLLEGKNYLLTKEYLAGKLKLSLEDYSSSRNGGVNLTLKHLSILQSEKMRLDIEKAKKQNEILKFKDK